MSVSEGRIAQRAGMCEVSSDGGDAKAWWPIAAKKRIVEQSGLRPKKHCSKKTKGAP